MMATKELYEGLVRELAEGREAAVVSRYFAASADASAGVVSEASATTAPETTGGETATAGATIEKSLYSVSDPASWAELLTLLESPGVWRDGPVTRIEGDASADAPALTVVEHYLPKPRMVVLGGGHIALALTKMAKLIDFSVTVFDDRPAFANPDRFPEADEVVCDDFSRVMERVKVRSSDYVVIVTRGHKHDTECLEGVLKGVRPAYTGMIGSRRRVAIVLKQLEDAGYDEELLGDVHTPIGLKIAAVTPAEISVAILAEIIQIKRAGFDKKGARAVAAHGSEINLTCDIEIAEWLARHGDEADALLTILTTKGPVPRETGAKMAISYEGRTAGTIGGGCAESDVMQDARTIIREGGWTTKTVDMTDSAEDDGMVCGGTMTVIIEKTSHP
ncbi:MAG: XdhC family protein [Clostridiales Family XIII bacterium]|jgi:xanthine dehydrogenase accessory factor|nr:XdhC family protein [Clostridiales Family XIII bacterium]